MLEGMFSNLRRRRLELRAVGLKMGLEIRLSMTQRVRRPLSSLRYIPSSRGRGLSVNSGHQGGPP